jgi:hypothetical protein
MVVASRVFVSEYKLNYVRKRVTILRLDSSFAMDSIEGNRDLCDWHDAILPCCHHPSKQSALTKSERLALITPICYQCMESACRYYISQFHNFTRFGPQAN